MKCEAQRVFSRNFARETGCGDEEPFCILGVWLRRCRDFDNAEAHRDFKDTISVAERRAYAEEHGWPLVEAVPKAKARPAKRRRRSD